MLALALLIFGVAMRLIIHPANFSPVIALVLFGGVYLNKKYSVLLPLSLMMITDVILGAHNMMIFTWGSLVVISLVGLWARKNKSFKNIAISSLGSATIFFIVTNFGVWLSGYYPATIRGLISCYSMAIPFFRMSLLSTIIYSFVFFGVYELVARRIKNTRLAYVL